MKSKILLIIMLILSLFIFACSEIVEENIGADVKPVENEITEDLTNSEVNKDVYVEIPMEEVAEDSEEEIMVTDSGVKYLVHPNKILSGGPPMDGIPSLDNPQYVSLEEADEWIEDNELVLAIIHKGIKRVYPLQILVWHEIVNDNIAGDPLLITYCPLCGSGIAFERMIDINGERKEVEVGTSGKLYNSNLVMYDRETQSYWTQIDGKAIVGELTGQELVEVSIDTVVWRDWKKVHPDSEVLSQKTGHFRNYGKDPYGSYYENSNLFFPVENEDQSVHPKTIIFGIEVNGVYKAYQEDDLIDMDGLIEDEVNGVNVKVKRDEAGIVTIMDVDTGNDIVKERDFWFAWYAFHPETGLYEK